MSASRYSLIFTLALTSVLNSCSSLDTKQNDTISSKINFSEKIILAALNSKMKSGTSSQTDSPDIQPSCVFEGTNHDSMDLSLDKFKIKLREGANKSMPLTEEQMKESFTLLKTGQVKSDIKDTMFKLFREIPNFPYQTLTGIPNIFRDPFDFLKLPGVNTAGKTAKIFIRPENRTFRLAILAYARMNGVNIEEKNIDDLYNFLEKGRESDFDALIEGGLHTMKDQYGLTDIEEAAQKLHTVSQTCMSKAA